MLSEAVPDAYLAELREDGVSYAFAGPDGRDLEGHGRAGRYVRSRDPPAGGAAAIKGAFLKAGLIDEISVLIHPAVERLAGVESIFEYPGEPDERPDVGQVLR